MVYHNICYEKEVANIWNMPFVHCIVLFLFLKWNIIDYNYINEKSDLQSTSPQKRTHPNSLKDNSVNKESSYHNESTVFTWRYFPTTSLTNKKTTYGLLNHIMGASILLYNTNHKMKKIHKVHPISGLYF